MFLYKFNPFTKKYYKYDTDEVDMFAPMFEETLHSPGKVEDMEQETSMFERRGSVCLLCNTDFESRNALFKHLGYMGIDIRTWSEKRGAWSMGEWNEDMGEFGLEDVSKRGKRGLKRSRKRFNGRKRKPTREEDDDQREEIMERFAKMFRTSED